LSAVLPQQPALFRRRLTRQYRYSQIYTMREHHPATAIRGRWHCWPGFAGMAKDARWSGERRSRHALSHTRPADRDIAAFVRVRCPGFHPWPGGGLPRSTVHAWH